MKRIAKSQTSKEELDKFWNRKFNITSYLFDKQLAFIEDESPFKVAICSRRAGKTTACAAHLIHTAINTPGATCLYITLTGSSGKKIIWKEFKDILRNFDLQAKLNEIDLSVTFPNNAVIYIVGAKDASEIEKYRGLALKLVYIDECQSFRSHIKELIDDIIGPALMDYAGTLCLIGTPGPVPTGYFYECCFSENWSKHSWTFWDNPFIPVKSKMTHQQVFDREMKRRGIKNTEEPSVQREWFGQWRLDKNALLIKYDPNINDFEDTPQHIQYQYVMGIDIGFKDADAISILAWSDHSPITYLVEELITVKQGLTELVDQVKFLQKKYDVAKIVMDMGGLGLKMGEEMIRRHQIPVEAADKKRKMENIEILNDSLRSGRFKAKKTSRFAQDSNIVEVDRDKSTPDRIVVSDRFHSDIIDSVLYAFKISPAFAYMTPPKEPHYGTREWAEKQIDEMWERELEGHIQAESTKKWENGDE